MHQFLQNSWSLNLIIEIRIISTNLKHILILLILNYEFVSLSKDNFKAQAPGWTSASLAFNRRLLKKWQIYFSSATLNEIRHEEINDVFKNYFLNLNHA